MIIVLNLLKANRVSAAFPKPLVAGQENVMCVRFNRINEYFNPEILDFTIIGRKMSSMSFGTVFPVHDVISDPTRLTLGLMLGAAECESFFYRQGDTSEPYGSNPSDFMLVSFFIPKEYGLLFSSTVRDEIRLYRPGYNGRMRGMFGRILQSVDHEDVYIKSIFTMQKERAYDFIDRNVPLDHMKECTESFGGSCSIYRYRAT